ncbi:hypothetical protein LCGC14_2613240 [marine sediment metagenome]|uniref:Uncharacterized protein n=1 Tax=marine sediment metagenome TaxID=412755 RepID=A0A0F9CGE6_9ZZZZ
MTNEVREFFHKKAAKFGYTEPCRCGGTCYNDEDDSSVKFISSDVDLLVGNFTEELFIRVDITSPSHPKPVRSVWHEL